MKNLRTTLFTVLFTSSLLSAETKPGDLFTTEGADFTIEGLVKSGAINPGQNMGKGPIGETSKPGRIEAYTKSLVVEPGTWREWEGTYTIIKPQGAAIFQLFHSGGQLWVFHLSMNSEGDIGFNRRGKSPGLPDRIVLAEKMGGKPLSIRIRSNGFDFEIFKKRPLEDNDWVPVTTGSYKKAEDSKIQFRWGMYSGQEKGGAVPNDAMHFVSGVTIR